MADGYAAKARLLPLQRADVEMRARLGEARGELALARQRSAELQARMADARNRYQQAATEEMKQCSARLHELEERLRPSKDQVERQSIRSPVDGVVMGLRVTAPGEVLAAGAPILDVVPSNEMLVVRRASARRTSATSMRIHPRRCVSPPMTRAPRPCSRVA